MSGPASEWKYCSRVKRFGYIKGSRIFLPFFYFASQYQIKGCLDQSTSLPPLFCCWAWNPLQVSVTPSLVLSQHSLQKIERSSTTKLDRWSIEITEITEPEPTLDQPEEHSGSNKESSSKDRRVSENIPFNIINNYFSIGVVRSIFV